MGGRDFDRPWSSGIAFIDHSTAGGAMGTCEVRADIATNRVYVTLAGFSGDEEMEQHVSRVASEVRRLKPGFVMISDISQMKSATARGTRALQDVMVLYKKLGISRIIRIVGDDVISKG